MEMFEGLVRLEAEILRDTEKVRIFNKVVHLHFICHGDFGKLMACNCLTDDRNEELHINDEDQEGVTNVDYQLQCVIVINLWLGASNNNHHLVKYGLSQNISIKLTLLLECFSNFLKKVYRSKEQHLQSQDYQKESQASNCVLNQLNTLHKFWM